MIGYVKICGEGWGCLCGEANEVIDGCCVEGRGRKVETVSAGKRSRSWGFKENKADSVVASRWIGDSPVSSVETK